MKMEQYIRTITGLFILGSLMLSQLHSPYWLFFTAFVGVKKSQSAFTGLCPMETILEKAFKVKR